MDFAKAFTFVTEDENWLVKMGIGATITFFSWLVFPVFLLAGYVVGVARNVMNEASRPLPDWSDLGLLFRDGVSVVIAQVVYTLPLWLILCVSVVAQVGFGGLTGLGEDAEMVGAAGIFATWGLTFCLVLFFALVLFFVSPAIIIQYVRTNELGACFRFGEVLGIARDNFGSILLAAIASFVAVLVANIVAGVISIIPCIGWLVGFVILILSNPWIAVASGHIYGQIAAAGGKGKMAF